MTTRSRSDLLACARTWDGYRSASFARSTGTLVVVVSNAEAGIDGDEANPWVTICDDHSSICTHSTLALARSWAPAPEEWCDGCKAADFRDYFDVADELSDEQMALTLDDLDPRCVARARRAAGTRNLSWPPYLPEAEEYALAHRSELRND